MVCIERSFYNNPYFLIDKDITPLLHIVYYVKKYHCFVSFKPVLYNVNIFHRINVLAEMKRSHFAFCRDVTWHSRYFSPIICKQ